MEKINSHIKLTKVDKNSVLVQSCEEGVMCTVCNEIVEEITREELQRWTTDKFEGGKKFCYRVIEKFRYHILEMDPNFFLDFENRLKNFLEKFPTMSIVLKYGISLYERRFVISFFVVSEIPLSIQSVFKDLIIGGVNYPTEMIYTDLESIDEYEFFNWSVNHKYTFEERGLIGMFEVDTEIRTKLENRILYFN